MKHGVDSDHAEKMGYVNADAYYWDRRLASEDDDCIKYAIIREVANLREEVKALKEKKDERPFHTL